MSDLSNNSKWPYPLAIAIFLTVGTGILLVVLTRLVLRLAG